RAGQLSPRGPSLRRHGRVGRLAQRAIPQGRVHARRPVTATRRWLQLQVERRHRCLGQAGPGSTAEAVVAETEIRPVRWTGRQLVLLDQTRLPAEEIERVYERWEDVAEAIRTLVVRGAPAIGVTAAFGVVLAARSSAATSSDRLSAEI